MIRRDQHAADHAIALHTLGVYEACAAAWSGKADSLKRFLKERIK